MKNLILASSSTYRKKLLLRIASDFSVIKPKLDEDDFKKHISEPKILAETLAEQKALEVFKNHPEAVVIASDQLVSLDGEILGKPHNFEGAFNQLTKMQGKPHHLFTSVCVMNKDRKEIYTDETILKMKALDEAQIELYINLDEPFDCAGSYKIEEHGIALFESIETNDHTAITGLPLIKLSMLLEEFGFISFI